MRTVISSQIPTQIKQDRPQYNVTPPEGVAETRKKLREIKVVADSTIPLMVGWDVPTCQDAILSMQNGIFYLAGLLWDSILTDDAVRAAINTRSLALTGCKKKIIPADHPDKEKALEVAKCVEENFDKFLDSSTITPMFQTALGLGFSISHMYWDPESYDGKCITPVITHWHPSNCWYHIPERRFKANTLNQSAVTVVPGDGEWILHAPTREYLGWLDGYIRNLWVPFLVRAYGWRDWSRYNEKHGMPMMKVKFPATAAEEDKNGFMGQITSLKNETSIPLPQGVDENMSWDVELMEATSNTWQTFQGTLQATAERISILILGQNLTSNVQNGSYAAAEVHDKIRHVYLADDAKKMSRTLNQILIPFAEYNYGDPKLAPTIVFDVAPPEDKKQTIDTMMAAIQAASASQGLPVDIEALLKDAGVPIKKMAPVPPGMPQASPMGIPNDNQPNQPNQHPSPSNTAPQPTEQAPQQSGKVVTGAPSPIATTSEDATISEKTPSVVQDNAPAEVVDAADKPTELKAYDFITKLMEHSSEEGKASFAPMVDATIQAINSAESYDQMKELLLGLAEFDLPDFTSHMKKTFTLATLTGGNTPFADEDKKAQ